MVPPLLPRRKRKRAAVRPPSVLLDTSPVLLPVGLDRVELVDLGAPGAVRGLRGMILVEAGGVLQLVLVGVEREVLARGVELQGLERNGEQLVTHPREGEDGIGDTPLLQVEHDLLDLAEALASTVDDAIANDGGGREDVGMGLYGGSGHAISWSWSFEQTPIG